MLSPHRFGLVAALLLGCHSASAQTTVPATVTVQQLAPQLVAFAGSQANFQNLVTGLAQGTPVQLFSVLPDGSTQVVTFTPAAAVPVAQIPSLLEATRQQLIGLGIATPNAEQLARALTGGIVPTALGGTQLTGSLAPENRPSAAVQTQSHVTPGVNAASGATTATNTSDSPLAPGATSRTPVAPPPTTPGPAATPTPAASTQGTGAAAHSAVPAGTAARIHAR
jgi:hypothetical protein